MKKYNQRIGKLGENIAIRYLRKHGYNILDRNIHFRCGEIDILAEKDRSLYFVEVKTRTSNKFGNIEASICPRKLYKFESAILSYLSSNDTKKPYFMAIILVYLGITKRNAKISYYEI